MNTPLHSASQWQSLPDTGADAPDEVQDSRVRFWLWLVLGACVLALVAIIGGYAFGKDMLRGSHLREQFSMGQSEDASQPMQLGTYEQGSTLLGRQPGQARYYSGPSELAMAAARGEVVIDEDGVIHEVELERQAAMDLALEDAALALEMVPDTLPPMASAREGLRPSDVTAVPAALPGDYAVAMIAHPIDDTPRRPVRIEAAGEDIFFGQ